ncbi:MAG: DUF2147 domain-containing protein [Hyphomicrobiaceae bacterium]
MNTISKIKTVIAGAVVVAAAAISQPAAAGSPTGIWIDHTGRGAVQITNCGGKLCGRIVWLQNTKHGSVCGRQIIGNAKPTGGAWDGWIFDPDRGRRFSVEIKMAGANRLRVMGYMGVKSLSETHYWRRATRKLPPCGTMTAKR